jgi:hypothetical protein
VRTNVALLKDCRLVYGRMMRRAPERSFPQPKIWTCIWMIIIVRKRRLN